MNDQGNGAFDLDEVTRRFGDSEQALNEARSRLERLAQAEHLAATASESLQDSAHRVAEYARAAGEVVGELAEVQRQARDVLEAGVRLLDGSELGEIKQGIEGLRHGQDELRKRVADVEAAEARASNAEGIIAKIKSQLPGRTLKNLGLEG